MNKYFNKHIKLENIEVTINALDVRHNQVYGYIYLERNGVVILAPLREVDVKDFEKFMS